MPIGAPDAFFRTRCPSMRQNSSIRLTGRGAYVDEYQSLVNNRVRKNAHTIIRKRLTIRIIGATAPIAARASLMASRLTPRGFPSPSGSRPFFHERPLGVFPGLAREPRQRLLRAWTGENPLQPRTASHSKHLRRPLPDCQCGYPCQPVPKGSGLKPRTLGGLAGDNRPQLPQWSPHRP